MKHESAKETAMTHVRNKSAWKKPPITTAYPGVFDVLFCVVKIS
jgi:hypothetical protein